MSPVVIPSCLIPFEASVAMLFMIFTVSDGLLSNVGSIFVGMVQDSVVKVM